MSKDKTYIVFEYINAGDPANSEVRKHICNYEEVLSWINASYRCVATTGKPAPLAVHELGPCIYDTNDVVKAWRTRNGN